MKMGNQMQSRDHTKLTFYVDYILDLIIDEIESLLAVELGDPADYYRYIQFNGHERKKVLFKLHSATGTAANVCHNYFGKIKDLKTILEPMKRQIQHKERLLRERGDIFGVGEDNEDGSSGYEKGGALVGSDKAAAIGEQMMLNDKLIIPVVSSAIRPDGFPDVVTFAFPKNFDVVVELQVCCIRAVWGRESWS